LFGGRSRFPPSDQFKFPLLTVCHFEAPDRLRVNLSSSLSIVTHCKCFGFCIAYGLGDFYAKAPRRTLIPRSPTCLSLRARCPLPSAFRRGSELPLRTGTDKPRPKIGTRHLLESKYLNWWTRDCNSWRSERQVGMARAARQGPAGRRQPAAGERTRPRTASQAAGPSKK
jgi:hypothetical protein